MTATPNDNADLWPQELLESSALDEIKSWRTAALQRLEKAETEADECTQLAAIYEQSGEQLSSKANVIHAEAKEHEAKKEEKAAEVKEREAKKIKNLAEQNFKLSDDKKREAKSKDRAIAHEKALSDLFAHHIRKKSSESVQ